MLNVIMFLRKRAESKFILSVSVSDIYWTADKTLTNFFCHLSKMKTHREKFLEKHHLEDKGYSLEDLSRISKVPESILTEVYKRGVGAYKTNLESVRLKGSFVKNIKAPPRYKLSKEQWAMARVYSFLDGNKKHDNDLRK